MNIHVLCVNSKNIRKTKYSNAFSPDHQLAFSSCKSSTLAIEKALKKAVTTNSDFIIIDNALNKNSEKSFRSLFAGILYRYEKTIQDNPKKLAKDPENSNLKLINYNKKKTHIFKLEENNFTAYTFAYGKKKVLVLPKGFDLEFATSLLSKATEAFENSAEVYPDGYKITEKTYKKLTFREKYFPVKSDTKGEVFRKILHLSALSIFLVAGIILIYNMFVLPMQNAIVQSEIQTIFYNTDDATTPKGETVETKNWSKLKKINKEIVGWIKINNTKIDYPVLEHKGDNSASQYYLYRNYKGESSGFGSIFLDYRSTKGLKSKNAILHGHHMDDGSMFADLMKYGLFTGNLSFYKKTPTIQISTEEGGTETYKIFSVFKSNVNPKQGEYFDFYCSDFESDAQFLNYIYNLQIRSLITTPVKVNENDKLLTLVTCSYEFDDFRTVIVARKCRKGESEKVDVGKAKIPPTSLWPQVYYTTYGRTRPSVSTFKVELDKNNVPWYDGNYKGEGSEELPTSTMLTLPKYTVRVYNRGKQIAKGKVEEGSSFTLPSIQKTFTKNGYKYTFTRWEVDGSKSASKITCDTYITAMYKKVKIADKKEETTKATKPKATKATKPKATKPKATETKATETKATEATTIPTTEPTEQETEATE